MTSGHGEVVGRPVVTAVLGGRQTSQMVKGEFSEKNSSLFVTIFEGTEISSKILDMSQIYQ